MRSFCAPPSLHGCLWFTTSIITTAGPRGATESQTQRPGLQLGWDGRGGVLQGDPLCCSLWETCGLLWGLQPPQKAKLRHAEMLRPGAEFLLSKSAFINQERRKKKQTNRERQKWEGKRKIPNGKQRSLILFKRNTEQHKGLSEPASAIRKSHRVSPAPNPSPSKRQHRACVTSKQSWSNDFQLPQPGSADICLLLFPSLCFPGCRTQCSTNCRQSQHSQAGANEPHEF